MEDIRDIFIEYIDRFSSIDIAEAEFKKTILDDEALRARYREWCESVGSTERTGFFDFSEEYMESQNDVWNTLSDYDE